MRAYKTIMWDGQEYSVPVEMKWLTMDSDGDVNVWTEKPVRSASFWCNDPSKRGYMVTLDVPDLDKYLAWEESLIAI